MRAYGAWDVWYPRGSLNKRTCPVAATTTIPIRSAASILVFNVHADGSLRSTRNGTARLAGGIPGTPPALAGPLHLGPPQHGALSDSHLAMLACRQTSMRVHAIIL